MLPLTKEKDAPRIHQENGQWLEIASAVINADTREFAIYVASSVFRRLGDDWRCSAFTHGPQWKNATAHSPAQERRTPASRCSSHDHGSKLARGGIIGGHPLSRQEEKRIECEEKITGECLREKSSRDEADGLKRLAFSLKADARRTSALVTEWSQ
jgi:hypothetical protein